MNIIIHEICGKVWGQSNLYYFIGYELMYSLLINNFLNYLFFCFCLKSVNFPKETVFEKIHFIRYIYISNPITFTFVSHFIYRGKLTNSISHLFLPHFHLFKN